MIGVPAAVERVNIFTPLGIRFWDPAEGRQVSDGLSVVARAQVNGRSQPVAAFQTGAGVYAFSGLPGMWAAEHPVDPPPGQAPAPTPKKPFVVEVTDQLSRYMPVVWSVDLPYTGLYGPTSGLPGFYLFSAPARAAKPNMAAVRAQLVDHTTQAAVPNAVLDLQVNGDRWFSISDTRGRVAVLFPYPTIPAAAAGHQKPLSDQQWNVTARIRYQPSNLTFYPGVATPDLPSVLGQAAGMLYSSAAHGLVSLLVTHLTYGKELFISSGATPALEIAAAP